MEWTALCWGAVLLLLQCVEQVVLGAGLVCTGSCLAARPAVLLGLCVDRAAGALGVKAHWWVVGAECRHVRAAPCAYRGVQLVRGCTASEVAPRLRAPQDGRVCTMRTLCMLCAPDVLRVLPQDALGEATKVSSERMVEGQLYYDIDIDADVRDVHDMHLKRQSLECYNGRSSPPPPWSCTCTCACAFSRARARHAPVVGGGSRAACWLSLRCGWCFALLGCQHMANTHGVHMARGLSQSPCSGALWPLGSLHGPVLYDCVVKAPSPPSVGGWGTEAAPHMSPHPRGH